jgi:hypothetical protein
MHGVKHPTAEEENLSSRSGWLARGDRKWSLKEAQRPNLRVVRVALGTGYNRGEGNRRPRELISHPKPLTVRFATFASLCRRTYTHLSSRGEVGGLELCRRTYTHLSSRGEVGGLELARVSRRPPPAGCHQLPQGSSTHREPRLHSARQVHYQQKMWASGGAEAQAELDATMRLLPPEVCES